MATDPLRSHTGSGDGEDFAGTEVEPPDTTKPPVSKAAKKAAKKSTKRAAKKVTYDVPKDINFAPPDKQSLADFAAAKKPSNNYEKALVAVYYMSDMLGKQVTVGSVIAAFKALNWSAPSDPTNNLHQAGSKGWLDTSDANNITVVWQGQNYLDSHLPKP
jgi:hypothetical protein